MAFRVEFTNRSESQLSASYNYVVEHTSPLIASRWLVRFKKLISSLEHFPQRHGIAREARELGYPYRRVHFGRRAGAFLIYYKITSSGDSDGTVTIVHIRRALRDTPDASDFGE